MLGIDYSLDLDITGKEIRYWNQVSRLCMDIEVLVRDSVWDRAQLIPILKYVMSYVQTLLVQTNTWVSSINGNFISDSCDVVVYS